MISSITLNKCTVNYNLQMYYNKSYTCKLQMYYLCSRKFKIVIWLTEYYWC